MLCGNHHTGNLHWSVVYILNRNLRLSIRPQPFSLSGFAKLGELTPQSVGIHNRRRHQLRSFITGISKHEALIARALLSRRLARCFTSIHALRNIRALRCEVIIDEHLVRMKHIIVIHVTNVADRLSDHLLIIKLCLGSDLAPYADDIAFHKGLASHAAVLILRHTRI